VTIAVLVLLALVAAAPLLAVPLRRVLADPVLPVAVVSVLLLALAAALAADVDEAHGWRLATALVLGVVAATTAGSNVVRAVFRSIRGEFLPARVRDSVRVGASHGDDDDGNEVGDGASSEPAGLTELGQLSEESTASTERPETVLRGGAWIGYLERAAVAATVLAGWPEGVALVLAVKGVGRYSELRETNAPEAFIIGTFASLLWAVAAAGTVHLLR
jgi:hypothetical protein